MAGYQVDYWIITTAAGTSYYYGTSYTYSNTSGASAVYLRVVMKAAATTYYATLIFDDNGGSGGPGSVTGSVTGTSSAVTIQIPYTVPTREGYTFLYWQVTYSSGTSTYYPGGYANVTGDPYGRSYTLYAIWQQKTTYSATLAFNANGGTGAPASVTGSSTESSTIPLVIPYTKPTRTNYTFLYWQYTMPSGTVVHYAPGDTVNATGKEGGATYTLYAVWELSGGGVYLYNGGWKSGTVYVYYNGAWKKATPYVYYNGAWRKGT